MGVSNVGLKENFIAFCEYQRTAYEYLNTYGSNNQKTIAAFNNANQRKREVLNIIDSIEEKQESYYDYIKRMYKEMDKE